MFAPALGPAPVLRVAVLSAPAFSRGKASGDVQDVLRGGCAVGARRPSLCGGAAFSLKLDIVVEATQTSTSRSIVTSSATGSVTVETAFLSNFDGTRFRKSAIKGANEAHDPTVPGLPRAYADCFIVQRYPQRSSAFRRRANRPASTRRREQRRRMLASRAIPLSASPPLIVLVVTLATIDCAWRRSSAAPSGRISDKPLVGKTRKCS